MKWLLRILIAVVVFYGSFQYADQQMGGGVWLIVLPLIALACLLAIFIGEVRGFKLHPMAYAGGSSAPSWASS